MIIVVNDSSIGSAGFAECFDYSSTLTHGEYIVLPAWTTMHNSHTVMKASVVQEDKTVKVEEKPIPVPLPNQIL